MRAAALAAAALIWLAPLAQASGIDQLSSLLQLDTVADVIAEEGRRQGDGIDVDMLDGRGGTWFRDRVAAIYAPPRIVEAVREGLAEALDDEDLKATLAFLGSDRGRRILDLEIAARIAIADPDVEEAARERYQDMLEADDPLIEPARRFIDANDMVDRNVAGALGSSFAFLTAIEEARSGRRSEDAILGEVWNQEPAIRSDTEEWLYAYLLMAYAPLPREDLDAYIAFSETEAGQALNRGLFAGFDEAYIAISRDLGLAVGEAMRASEL